MFLCIDSIQALHRLMFRNESNDDFGGFSHINNQETCLNVLKVSCMHAVTTTGELMKLSRGWVWGVTPCWSAACYLISRRLVIMLSSDLPGQSCQVVKNRGAISESCSNRSYTIAGRTSSRSLSQREYLSALTDSTLTKGIGG